jgi:MoxR-like ATPase
VLLIDEIDRADEPFEAFLLELLSDFQLTVPEFGTLKAAQPPIVVITSNRTREVHDALRRRCLYHWVDFPTLEAESRILSVKAPQLGKDLRDKLVAFIHKLRDEDLFKQPGVAESIDWAHALTQLDVVTLTPDIINDTLGSLLKYQDDIARVQGSEAARLLAEIQAAA